ncbi:MAG: AzlC family ABC transporter permease [Actinomycetota bacterium]
MAISLRPDRQALADMAPVAVPAVPFGFIVGVAIGTSELPTWAGVASSQIVFAGASQLALITLAGPASFWAVLTAVLVINSRHLMYSAALAPTFRHQPRWMRWIGPYVLIDQVFALATMQSEREPASFRRYYLTIGVAFWLIWNAVVPLGLVVGSVVPDSWRLDYAAAIMFAGLAMFAVDRIPAAIAATVGGVVSLVAVGLRDRLGIVIGALAGVIAASIYEEWNARRTTDDTNPMDGSGEPEEANA